MSLASPVRRGTGIELVRQMPDADLLDRLFEEHFSEAPERAKEELYAAVSPTVAGDALVHLARVRFEQYVFELDVDGRWSVVLPIYDAGAISDFAAFCLDDDKLRRPYRLGLAVGYEAALWDAHYHPQRRMLVHYDVWSYLHGECSGCLPVSWRKTALALLSDDIREVVYANDQQAAKAGPLLAAALRPPRPFVLKATVAA